MHGFPSSPGSIIYAKQTPAWGVKSAKPIRRNIVTRHVRPKTLISADHESPRSYFIKAIFNSLNDK